MNPRARTAAGDPAVSAAEAGALFAGLAGARHILVAVSGGPDSLALLALLHGWARSPGRPDVSAATVDHGLRAGSADEAAMVASYCARLGLPHATLCWTGGAAGPGLQERARDARYALLGAHARALAADMLATAHTLDDQAETVLMRMAAGSGPAGLAGMKARVTRDGVALVRPLLSVPKARLIATCAVHDITPADDASNRDPRFSRVRWRGLMPGLAGEGLDAGRLALLAARLARAERALEATARATLDGAARDDVLDARALAEQPEEIVLRVLALALAEARERAGLPARSPRLERLESCTADLLSAVRAGVPGARTLAGFALRLDAAGRLTIAPEPARRRGLHRAGEIGDAEGSHPLGKGRDDA